jgi:GH24 family phage-related lysozyme (muramidase)
MADERGQLSPTQFIERLKGFEGYADHLYLDTEGKITVGVGLMYGSAEALVASHITFRHKVSGKIASATEVKEEYRRVSKLAKSRSVSFYRNHGLLSADGADLQGRLVRRLAVAFTDAMYFYNTGKPVSGVKFEHFTDLPTNVQLALMDMAFNLGRSKLCKFQNLRAFLKQGDWQNAAKESHRRGIQSSRNEAIYQWIANQPKDIAPMPKVKGAPDLPPSSGSRLT